MEHFKPLFSSGTSDPAKIRPLKVWLAPRHYLEVASFWEIPSKALSVHYSTRELDAPCCGPRKSFHDCEAIGRCGLPRRIFEGKRLTF